MISCEFSAEKHFVKELSEFNEGSKIGVVVAMVEFS